MRFFFVFLANEFWDDHFLRILAELKRTGLQYTSYKETTPAVTSSLYDLASYRNDFIDATKP